MQEEKLKKGNSQKKKLELTQCRPLKLFSF